jgi:hypothetical protein
MRPVACNAHYHSVRCSQPMLLTQVTRFVNPIAIILTLLLAAPAFAQPPSGGAAAADDVPRGMFEKGSLGVEFGGAVLIEAWNLNDRQEWLADGSAAVFWSFTRRATLLVEFHASRIEQVSSRNAFVNGLVTNLRFRLFDIPGGTLFGEFGPGISWSDTRTPPRGTQFNYLIQGTVGVTRRLGSRSHLVTGFRWLHLSNASREGRGRNPDIEALGAYGGLSLAF